MALEPARWLVGCGISEQGLLPSRLSARMPKTKAPWLAILMTFGVIVVTMPRRDNDDVARDLGMHPAEMMRIWMRGGMKAKDTA